MIKEEAYNKMSEGYMVTHKLFKPGEFLYMDKQFIIRNEDGTTFENDWDVLTTPEWNIDWFIYKGKFNKGIPSRTPIQRMDTSKIPMMDTGRLDYKEPIQIEALDYNEDYVEYNPMDADATLKVYQDIDKMENEWQNDINSRKRHIIISALIYSAFYIVTGIILNVLVWNKLSNENSMFMIGWWILIYLLSISREIYIYKKEK